MDGGRIHPPAAVPHKTSCTEGNGMSRRRKHVLLADGDAKSRETLRAHLANAGYRVAAASSGSEIILQCEIDPPDVLILAVRLPDTDGYEVCARLRQDALGADITVIMLTEPEDEMARAYAGQMVQFAGGDFFLAKPYDATLVVKVVDELTRQVRWESSRSGPPPRRRDRSKTSQRPPALSSTA